MVIFPILIIVGLKFIRESVPITATPDSHFLGQHDVSQPSYRGMVGTLQSYMNFKNSKVCSGCSDGWSPGTYAIAPDTIATRAFVDDMLSR